MDIYNMSDQGGQAARILVVDDDHLITTSVLLRAEGHEVATAHDAQQALTLLAEARRHPGGPFRLMISDVHMHTSSGLDLLRRVRREYPSMAVVLVTGYPTVESAVEAMRLGAMDYLTKPVPAAQMKESIGRALRLQAMLEDVPAARGGIGTKNDPVTGLGRIIGHDRRMLRIHELVQAVAPTRTTVLLTGESGTGKSMVARAIHELSPRAAGPMATISCGSIPETLLESEIFGHVRGAFTGAESDKPGRIKAAEGGTLFLDEINSATPNFQVKLLRVLQERVYEPVGAHETRRADVRFVLATNEPLDQLVRAGRFREDLYYRINVVTIDLPPLRDRNGDVAGLARHFLARHAREAGKIVTGFDPRASEAMLRYSWPGNVRELENAVERAVVLAARPVIRLEDLPDAVQNPPALSTSPDYHPRDTPHLPPSAPFVPQSLKVALMEPEKQLIVATLRHFHGNRQKSAAALDMDRTTLYKKMKQHGIEE